MSSFDASHSLEGLIEDNFGFVEGTEENKILTKFYETYREQLENGLDSFEEDTMSWRTHRYSIWMDIPEPPEDLLRTQIQPIKELTNMDEKYCRKIFLADEDLSSTSTLVCYEGPPAWKDKDRPEFREKFVEIGNCHCKIRLHKTDAETDRQFLLKIALLRDQLSEFLDYLYQRLKVEEPIPSDETDITDPELYEFPQELCKRSNQ
jgi:hypothetical protein